MENQTSSTTLAETAETNNVLNTIAPKTGRLAMDQIDDLLKSCQQYADTFIKRRNASHNALYTALGEAYYWWTRCNQVDGRFNKYLDDADIKNKNLKRRFSSLVRLTFQLNQASQAENDARLETKSVNRYATALDAVHRHFEGSANSPVSGDVVTQFIDEHGVQVLIDEQVAFEAGNRKGDDVDSQSKLVNPQTIDLPTHALLQYFQKKESVGAVTFDSIPTGENGLVSLLGRVSPYGYVDVIDFMQCADETLTSFLLSTTVDLEKLPSDLNFFSETLELGSVIKEGVQTQLPVDPKKSSDLRTSKKLDTVRMLLCKANSESFLVSLARADTSVVVHAFPKVEIGHTKSWDIYLDTQYRRWFEKHVMKPNKRRQFGIQIGDSTSQSDVCWELSSTKLDKPKKLHLRSYDRWAEKREDRNAHLIVDLEPDITWGCEVTIPLDEFESINRTYLQTYAATRKSKKRAAVLSMSFSGSAWQMDHTDAKPVFFPVNTVQAPKSAGKLKLFGIDVAPVTQKIVDLQPISEITIRANIDGLLQFSFETAVGCYAVSIPTVYGKDPVHNTKLLRKYVGS